MRTETRIVPLSRKEDLARAKFLLDTVNLSEGWIMELTTAKRKRSTQANRYYWQIVKTLAESLWGEKDPTGMHEYLKATILAPMLNREGLTVCNSKSRELMNDWFCDWQEWADDEDSKKRLYRRLSTTWLNNKGMSLYIDVCKDFAAGIGIVISEPEDMR